MDIITAKIEIQLNLILPLSLSLFVSKSESHIANVGDLETDCLGRDKLTFLYDWTGQTLDRERNVSQT